MKCIQFLSVIFVVFLTTVGHAWSGDFIKARQLYIDRDYEEAFKEFVTLAQEGDHRGQMFVGRMLMKGLGVNQDINGAVKWFQQSAFQGNGYSLDQMGIAHITGRGAQRDIVTANMYFKLANLRGFAVQNRLKAEANMTQVQILRSHDLMQAFIKKHDFSIPTLKRKKN